MNEQKTSLERAVDEANSLIAEFGRASTELDDAASAITESLAKWQRLLPKTTTTERGGLAGKLGVRHGLR